jgi:tryptophanyl-tRNA synthetase
MSAESGMRNAEGLTPETEAVWKDWSQNLLEHARRMERERDQARAAVSALCQKLDLYMAANSDVKRIAEERNQARAEVAEMNQRLLESVASYLRTMEALRAENRRLERELETLKQP